VKAQERREEKLGDTTFDEIRRLKGKALELLGKMESEGDYRGAIVAAREVRERLVSLNGLLTKAESGSGATSSASKLLLDNDANRYSAPERRRPMSAARHPIELAKPDQSTCPTATACKCFGF
jgi:hypothetical protein